ncbi:MAG TPA: type II toxin-antitoxin system prevent-host-death family antitoxin [Candidatus Sulfotelmatobacter sp.]|nr:type II toxin-antitoxin system prevent-host-death family antitoxin [Candidatus Sulfotelmatobacter sp.]
MKYVSAREANQDFSKLLAEAAAGEEIIITRRGTAVAKLGPARPETVGASRRAAVERLLGSLDLSLGNVRFRRDDLYDR